MSRYASSLYCAGIQLKKHHLSFLIGKRGVAINGIKQQFKVSASIHQRELVYNLSGTKANVDAAAKAITRHMSWIDNLPAFKSARTVPRKNLPDEDGWTVSGSSPVPPKLKESPKFELDTSNKFAGFDSDAEDDDEAVEAAPAKKVTFAHDATGEDEIREFDKNEPPIYVSNSSGDDEPSDEDVAYLASKRSTSGAWRPRSRSQSPAAASSDEGKSYIQTLRDHLANGSPKPKRSVNKKSWADIADEDDSDFSDEEDLFLGSY